MNYFSCMGIEPHQIAKLLQILGNVSILSIDGHLMTKLNKDIFAGSLAAGKLERLHLSNGLLADIPIEAFQVRLKSAFNSSLLKIGLCLERSFWPSIPPFSFNVW